MKEINELAEQAAVILKRGSFAIIVGLAVALCPWVLCWLSF
jgi:hypothetical protein